MGDEAWLRLLDSDVSAEGFARELSPGLLTFVKDEGSALVAIKRAKVLLSFLYLSDDRLAELETAIIDYCNACEQDAEDWVRVVSGVILRWLKLVPRDREDAFMVSTKEIARVIAAAEKVDPGKFCLPMDVLPTHWPFLASEALPENLDLAGSGKNQHFTVRERPDVVKKVKMITTAETAADVLIPSMISVWDKLTPKVKELLENAPLLTPENRQMVLKFFDSPSTCGINPGTEYLLSESRSNSVERPGQIEILQRFIKLDPSQPKWNTVKRIKYTPGKV